MVKYRVKFKCYWYNTGAADNHYYINYEDFNTLEEAQVFEKKIVSQVKVFKDTTEGWIERHKIWKESENYIEIENGFICDDITKIVRVFPEREESL